MLFVAALTVLLAVELDGKVISKRMIGGTPAKRGEFPWIAAVKNCGAVMIHRRVALTAAHCVCDNNYTDFCVHTMNHTLFIGGIKPIGKDAAHEIHVDRKNIAILGGHPNMNRKDFAVMILDDTLPSNLPTVSLPDSFPRNAVPNEDCYILGRGYSERIIGQGILEKVPVSGVVNETSGWIIVNDKDSSTIRGACNGDSGGPYVCRKEGSKEWTLYGIAHGSRTCGVDTKYWNVGSSLSFITSVVPKDVASDLKKKKGRPYKPFDAELQ